MELLSSTLTAFSRLLEGLRFAEVVPLVDEFLGYLEVCFQWAPSLSLDAALNVSCADQTEKPLRYPRVTWIKTRRGVQGRMLQRSQLGQAWPEFGLGDRDVAGGFK